MANIEILRAETVWCNSNGHDKVYSVQLLRDENIYRVESQYGKRGSNLRKAPTTYTGTTRHYAEVAYNELLQAKVRGSKGSHSVYGRTISPAIIPAEYGGIVKPVVQKTEQLANSKKVDAFHDFLASETEGEPIVKADGDISSGLDALTAMYGE